MTNKLALAPIAAVLFLFAAGHAEAAEDAGFPAPSGDSSILSPDARVERVFDGGCAVAEGIAAGRDGKMYFSDVTFTAFCKDEAGVFPQGGHIWRYDPVSDSTEIFLSPSNMSNGIEFDAKGDMVFVQGPDSGGRRVMKKDMATGRSFILTHLFEGRPYNGPNDVSIDEAGRIYFTDPKYFGYEPMTQAQHSVFRIDPDGSVTRLISDAGKVNGLLVSPDQKTLYVGAWDNGSYDFIRVPEGEGAIPAYIAETQAIYAYDLAADGSVGPRRDFLKLPQGAPDGFKADVDGNLYVTLRHNDPALRGVYVYSPAGEELARIPMPDTWPTNVAFGRGDAARTLYITASNSLFRITVERAGYQLPAN